MNEGLLRFLPYIDGNLRLGIENILQMQRMDWDNKRSNFIITIDFTELQIITTIPHPPSLQK